MQTAIYIRWSTDEQSQGTTMEVQLDSCRHYALSQGWDVPEVMVFVDDGYSGATLDRPAMKRLRQAIDSGLVACVVVYTIDRLSRNIVDATNLVLHEWDGRCHLACVRQPVDTRTEIGRMFFSILAMFADFERGQIRARTVAGKLKRAQEGRSITEAPYGYGRQDGKLTVNPDEAGLVRQIYEWYTGGLGVTAITKRLNAEHYQTRDGFKWGSSSVMRLLQNPTYTGRHVYGRRRVGKKGEAWRVQRETPLVDIEGTVPSIISTEVWDEAQRLREDRRLRSKQTGRAIGSKHLLTGIARCRCGSFVISKQDSSGTWYYVCGARRYKGACDCGWIPHRVIHEAVHRFLQTLRQEEVHRTLLGALDRKADRHHGMIRDRHASAEKTLRSLDQELQKLDSDYRRKLISVENYDRLSAQISKERSDLQSEAQSLASKVSKQDADRSHRELALRNLEQLDQWDTLDQPGRKQLLRDVLTRLTVYRQPGGGKLEIEPELFGIVPDELPQ